MRGKGKEGSLEEMTRKPTEEEEEEEGAKGDGEGSGAHSAGPGRTSSAPGGSALWSACLSFTGILQLCG